MQLLIKTVAIVLMPVWLATSAVAVAQTVAPASQQETTELDTAKQNITEQNVTEQNTTKQAAAEKINSEADAVLTSDAVAIAEPRQSLPFQRQEPPVERNNTSGISLGKIAISLAAVLLLVVGLGWLFKKLTLRLPGSQHIKVICSVPLGQRERLLVIEIQGKQRVIGVTPQSINMLFELEKSLPETKLASDFHTQLQSFLKK
jgi:flagellar biosynthetic protein FliO